MCGGVVGVLAVSLAGCPSLSCWRVVAAVVSGVGSAVGGSGRRPRRRMMAAVAARAPAEPVRSAVMRFFPAPRDSSRLRPDVRSPNALPRLAGNPGLGFARERLGRRRAATAAGRDAGCLLAPPGRAMSRLEGVRLACRRLDGRRAVSLLGIGSLSQVGQWLWFKRGSRSSSPSLGIFPQIPAAFAEVPAGRDNAAGLPSRRPRAVHAGGVPAAVTAVKSDLVV
jgi:hypothetical protein